MSGLLSGVRVIEVALLAPDGLCMHLADLGADVIKVEQPGLGDYVRSTGKSPSEDVSVLHRLWNRGKRSITIDLRTPGGVEVFLDLAAGADAVVEGLRPGSLARRGLGPDDLRRVNPRLVFASICGFGQTGPYKDMPSHGIGFDAYGGLAPPVPGPNDWPSLPPDYLDVGTIAGPLYGALGVVAAILHSRTTGEPSTIDMAEADAAALWSASRVTQAAARRARGARGEKVELAPHPGLAQGQNALTEDVRYQYYKCADGRHVLFMASERKFWENFGNAVGRPDIPVRYPSAEVADHMYGNRELRAELVEIFATRDQAEWVALGMSANFPCVPGHVGGELLDDPQFQARTRWLPAEEHGIAFSATPIRSDPALPDPRRAPTIGEHNDEILRTVLGYDDARVASLHHDGVLG